MSVVTKILKKVAIKHDLVPETLCAGTKERRVRAARNEAAYCLYRDTTLTTSQITQLLGLSVRTTVEFGIKKHAESIGKPLPFITDLRDGPRAQAIDYIKFAYLVAAWLDREKLSPSDASRRAGVSRSSILKATNGQGLNADTFVLIRDAAQLDEGDFRIPASRETHAKQSVKMAGRVAHA